MNVAEKVATLEALLKKVQHNAAIPRQRAQDVAGTPTTAGAGAQPYRAPEPSFDDVISAVEAHSPDGFPVAGKSPKLTALAPPLHSTPTPPAAQVKPASPGIAKAQPAPAAKAPAAAGVAKAQPAPAAKAPVATPARAPAASRPDTMGKLLEDGEPSTDMRFPPTAVVHPTRREAEPEKPAAKAPGLFDLPHAPRTASSPDFDSELSFADVLPEEPKARAKAEPPPMPKVKPADAARMTPLPDAARPATPGAASTAPGVGAPDSAKAAIAEAKAKKPGRAADETTVERDVLADHVVDDEPTVVRTGLEEELAEATRRPEIEEEETAVASQRAQARVIAHSVVEEPTVEAASVEAAAAALRAEVEAERKTAPKPAEPRKAEPRPAEPRPAETKPAEAKAEPRPAETKPKEAAQSRDEEPTEIGRRRPQQPAKPVEEPKEGKRSPSLLLLAAAACVLAAAAAYWGFTQYGGESPTPPQPQPPPTGKAATTATPTQVTAPTGTPGTVAPPPDSAAPSAGAATSASAAPPTSAAPSAAPPAVDASALPPNKGYIVVTSPEPATVYVNGVWSGNTGEPLAVACGTKNVRLGKLTTDAKAVPDWISPGQPAIIACKATTPISLAPGASPPPGPGPAPAPQPGGDSPY